MVMLTGLYSIRFMKKINLEAHLKKGHMHQHIAQTHPGVSKQSIPLALAIFDETTYASHQELFPESGRCSCLYSSYLSVVVHIQLES